MAVSVWPCVGVVSSMVTEPVGASLTLATAAVFGTGHRFGCALAVGVAGHDSQRAADIGLAGDVGGACGADDVDAATLPLVADRAQAVQVAQRVAGRERLALRRCRVVDRDAAGGRVVDVGHRGGVGTGHRFGRALAVGVAGHDSQRAADIGLAGDVGGACGADDVDTATLPLVADRAQAVQVGQ